LPVLKPVQAKGGRRWEKKQLGREEEKKVMRPRWEVEHQRETPWRGRPGLNKNVRGQYKRREEERLACHRANRAKPEKTVNAATEKLTSRGDKNQKGGHRQKPSYWANSNERRMVETFHGKTKKRKKGPRITYKNSRSGRHQRHSNLDGGPCKKMSAERQNKMKVGGGGGEVGVRKTNDLQRRYQIVRNCRATWLKGKKKKIGHPLSER